MWIRQDEDFNMTDWMKEAFKPNCLCGKPMLNWYNSANQCTNRKCSDPECRYTAAAKVAAMCDILEIKGIKEAKALSILGNRKYYQVLDLITNEKPKVSLGTFMRLQFINGVDNRWFNECNDYLTLDDFITNYRGQYSYLITPELVEQMRDMQNYVTVIEKKKQKYATAISGTVMITGNLRGFKDRNQFIAGLNAVFQGAVALGVAESKRKTGIMALIKEEDAPFRGKAQCAKENGIPIMTPTEFTEYIIKKLSTVEVKEL